MDDDDDDDGSDEDGGGGLTALVGAGAGVPTFESCLPCCGACGLVFVLGICTAFFLLLYRMA